MQDNIALVNRLSEVFPVEPAPDIRAVRGDGERDRCLSKLLGRKWSELEIDDSIALMHCTSFLDPKEFAYYLPAFLKASLPGTHDDSELLAFRVAARLTPKPASNSRSGIDPWNDFENLLSEDSRQLIAEFLDAFVKSYFYSFDEDDYFQPLPGDPHNAFLASSSYWSKYLNS